MRFTANVAEIIDAPPEEISMESEDVFTQIFNRTLCETLVNKFSDEVYEKYLDIKKKPFVVEIGSNDF